MSSIPYSQLVVSISATLGAVILGIIVGWSSPMLPVLLKNSDFEFSPAEAAWAGSIPCLGALFSCVPAGIIRNRYGTKILMMISSIPSISGWTLLSFASSSWMVILGRLLSGFGGSGVFFIVPIYIGEIASKNIRGALGIIAEVQVKVGVALVYILGSVMPSKSLNLFALGIVTINLIIFLILPETPVYLVKRGKIERARKVLKFLRKNNHDIESELNELQEDQENSKSYELVKLSEDQKISNQENFVEKAQNNSFRSQLKNEAVKKAFLILNVLFVLFQACGIGSIIFYSSKIIAESNVNLSEFTSSTILGLVQVLSIILSIPLIDLIGRKFLLYFSFIVMCIGHLFNGLYFHMKILNFDVTNFNWVPLTSLSIFHLGFTTGLAAVTFVFMGELFPLEAKKIFAPMTMMGYFITSFSVTLAFPFLFDTIGIHFVFYFFAISCIFGIIFNYKVIPETKGKSLSEIQRILSEK